MTDREAERKEWIDAKAHSIYHSLLRSQAACRECDYQAPMDGPDRIAAAIDRLTAAINQLKDSRP